ncbi:hypothetical protein [Paenibacillus planticolens]|uniref:Uncharacterized protein n=1 Tax=Paenibacillus planticolens TaxID=2654976 RepID=A0ABX1ZL78_9BACL|nr:hypothetical protein [Paenibacillus planticolens]NOU99508.1 hypothetical protein [Paenibacillus planticolens]
MKKMDTYPQTLLSCEMHLRRRLLLTQSATNFTWKDIGESYDVTPTKLNTFIHVNKRASVDINLVSFLSALTRVPPGWLINKNPSNEWNLYSFDQLDEAFGIVCSEGELIQLLYDGIESRKHDMKCVILKVGCLTLYLRIECYNGGFMVEMFNYDWTIFQYLGKLLSHFKCSIGYIPTVTSYIITVFYKEPIICPSAFISSLNALYL